MDIMIISTTEIGGMVNLLIRVIIHEKIR